MQVQDELITPRQCEIHWERTADGLKVLLRNLGRSLALDVGPRIHTGVEIELQLPSVFWVGNSTIQISDPLASPEYDHSLTAKTHFRGLANQRGFAETFSGPFHFGILVRRSGPTTTLTGRKP